tara:strand:+ start:10074 stop:11285 length:1212 start_codon:yes stop_codon:yes gene_type:complete
LPYIGCANREGPARKYKKQNITAELSMTIRLNQGHIAALLLACALIVWMVAGSLTSDPEISNSRPLVMDTGLQRVQVERMQGEAVSRDIVVSAHTAPNRRVEVKAEIRAKVTAIHKQKGEAVQRGELILELDARDWPARVKQAQAALRQRRIEADSARRLADKGLANQAQVAQADTALANAEAELTNARIQLAATRIKAPFDGIIDQRFVEIGDFVKDSTPLLTVLDFSPYLIRGEAAEDEAGDIHIGDDAWASLVNGERVEGKVRYIAAEANASTRTFPIEVEIANPSGKMTSGLTADIHVPQPDTYAYFVSPALLILNDQGDLGLKGINDKNQVVFLPAKLLKADNTGIWLYGLGEEADVITVGGGFVKYGQTVEPVYTQAKNRDTATTPPADNSTAMTAE